jgi:hypothetical protein
VVHECTQFWDRNRPDYEEMTKLALSFSEARKRTPGFRQSGFQRVPVVVEDQPENEDEAEAARSL